MTMPDVTAPHPLGAVRRAGPVAVPGSDGVRPSAARSSRSLRDLTPFFFLAMILIPSLIVLGLAIADPGMEPSGAGPEPAVTFASGS